MKAFSTGGAALVIILAGGCGTASSPTATTTAAPPSPPAPTEVSDAPEPSASTAVDTVAELTPGSYADVVTNDLVLRSRPGGSAESEIFPDQLNAPISVYLVDGPVEADGYRWFLVVAFEEAGSVPGLVGWAAAEGRDGEVWLQPVERAGGGEWSTLNAADAPTDLNTRSAVLGIDGSIYFFGGFEVTDAPNGEAWAFDLPTGEWRELAAMPTPRARPFVAASEDGLFYVIGGAPTQTVSSDDPSIVEVYDAATDRWTRAADVPVRPLADGVALAGDDGAIILFEDNRVHSYDPSTAVWTSTTGESRMFLDAVAGEGTELKLLEFGGAVVPYDVVSGAFGERIEPPGITRYDAAMAVGTDGRVYLLGGSVTPGGRVTCSGWRMDGPEFTAIPLVEAFDPATAEWTTLAPLPARIAEPAAFATPEGILVVGRSVPPGGGVVMAQLSFPPIVAGVPLAFADQEVSPSGCGT